MIQMSSTLSTDGKKRKVKSHTWQWDTQSSETELKSRIWENIWFDAHGLGTAKNTSLNIFSTQSRKVISWTTMHICLFYCFFHHIFYFHMNCMNHQSLDKRIPHHQEIPQWPLQYTVSAPSRLQSAVTGFYFKMLTTFLFF